MQAEAGEHAMEIKGGELAVGSPLQGGAAQAIEAGHTVWALR